MNMDREPTSPAVEHEGESAPSGEDSPDEEQVKDSAATAKRERMNQLKILATSLDALAHSYRTGNDAVVPIIAERVLDLWGKYPDVQLTVEGTLLTYGD